VPVSVFNWSSPLSLKSSLLSIEGGGYPAISCSSAHFCMAMGSGISDNTSMQFVKVPFVWNGKRWTASPTALLGAGLGGEAVSCPSSTFCAAVGSAGDGVQTFGVASTWNGSSWSRQETISPQAGLDGVSCPTANFCVAVGGIASYGASYNASEQVAVTWDGNAWSAPRMFGAAGSGALGLTSVACPTTRFCLTVNNSSQAYEWNGQTWGPPMQIEPSSTNSNLSGISCPTESFCMIGDSAGRSFTFNGQGWSRPRTVQGTPSISTVSCSGPDLCVAISYRGREFTWNGEGWTVPTLIDPGAQGATSMDVGLSVSCTTSGFCAAEDSGDRVITGS
jgi:hypothetical protein